MLPEFDLVMPRTLAEALQWLAEDGPDITPLAGGTNLIPDMRAGSHRPRVMMDISRLDELRGIRVEDGYLVVGAAVIIAELLDDLLVDQHAGVLRQASAVMANPLVRNRATVGGNLVNASPAADMAPPLLVLAGEVELVSQQGSRHVPLEEFFSGAGETVRQPHELLSSVRCPLPASSATGAYRKLALRKAGAVSVVSVATILSHDGGGLCDRARIALGAVAPTPIRAHAAEAALCGQSLTPDTIAVAARLAAEATCCIDDVRASAAYRTRVTEVLARRVLDQAASG
jgi:CO/xanthine dehydrogenase FAD-binding subunit